MQEIHHIDGGINGAGAGGRVFGDRRSKHHGHIHHQQALKCPRCDSLNTKFCYYNNYNLSQPRHFCKNCRRYWTKGGVLRNVPVGGGCRKSKRSKPKSSSNPARKIINSVSSSDSSQVTESEVNGGSEYLIESNRNNPSIPHIGDNQALFSSENEEFANLIRNQADPLGLVAANQLLNSQSQSQWEIGGGDVKIEGGMLDPTVRIEFDDLLQNRGVNGGLAGLDWPAGETAACDEKGCIGLFDLLPSSAVDYRSYWSQTTSYDTDLHPQWSDHANSDLPLFFP